MNVTTHSEYGVSSSSSSRIYTNARFLAAKTQATPLEAVKAKKKKIDESHAKNY